MRIKGWEWLLICCIAIFLLWAFLILLPKAANAESAIVSFDDAEHLVALTNSVVGVCDSTIKILEMADADSLDYDSCMVAGQWVLFYRFYFYPDTIWMSCPSYRSWSARLHITCRRLVGVTVVPEPYGPISQTTGAIIDTRQWAIIFYEEVK